MIDNKLPVIDQDLRNAYELAMYRLFDSGILFKINQKNDDLALLLSQFQASNGYFISAFNPKSRILEKTDNLQRHELLKSKLLLLKGTIFEGIGEDANDEWPGELSFLVIGISRAAIIDMARFFGQLAVVEIGGDGDGQLLWC